MSRANRSPYLHEYAQSRYLFSLITRVIRLCVAQLPRLRGLLALGSVMLLAGCRLELLSPQGDIGEQEKTLILLAMGLMLLVVIPVIVLTLYFAWRYREGNTKAVYAPKWSHSTRIEIIVWSIPCIIVGFLGLLIWETTHSLDPYKPLESKVVPINVEVVALNWKWLFIYPDYGVASVNELAIPTDTPIAFKLTAASIMNSFFIPQLGSQVYAMSGMQTQLHLIANAPGVYHGLSAAYSGQGFSDMNFKTLATSREEFKQWIAQAKQAPQKLDRVSYKALEEPSIKHDVEKYASVEPGLFLSVVNQYMHDMQGNPTMRMSQTSPLSLAQQVSPMTPAQTAMLRNSAQVRE